MNKKEKLVFHYIHDRKDTIILAHRTGAEEEDNEVRAPKIPVSIIDRFWKVTWISTFGEGDLHIGGSNEGS